MKKIILVLFALMIASPALATDFTNYSGSLLSGSKLTCGTGANQMEIGLSPKVAALYRINATTPAQWYLIAAVHIGGNEAYATAQDLTKIYKHPYTAGSDTPASLLTALPADMTSESQWSSAGWGY